MSVLTEVEDLLAVKKFASQHAYVDMENLILLGESQGGFVSGLAAARCGAEVKKLVMIFRRSVFPIMQGGEGLAVRAIRWTMCRKY